ncbi:MAG: PhzF family phenazine biosynthesis protein [Tannerella sp.]|jgi:PhzF family phenazine biosynthesis protein|nr:PhzF family phenazine biosynthesis protein [Tannerella sp.]
MKQKIYQVDAFADKLFSGNPAAVCPLEKWLSNETMQQIATENNLAETAFYVKKDTQYEIRWFTPAVEVDLCGHATLATAFVLFDIENHPGNEIRLYSHRSGLLTVTKNNQYFTLNFPADTLQSIELTSEITNGFNIKPHLAFKGKTDYLLIYDNENEIRSLKPDLNIISKLDARGIIVSSKGEKNDFVSRFFAPRVGVNEDPVTGSAHTTLTPYWSGILNKKELTAMQLSERTGFLICKNLDDRVEISGQCKLYLSGEIYI